MAVIDINLFSKSISKQMNTTVIVPFDRKDEKVSKKKWKTLWLLHGMKSDNRAWIVHTDIERISKKYNLAVIMPDADNSFYTNMVYGGNYFDYISYELPELLRILLPLSDRGEDNYIAGNSMGGYGAFKIAMSNENKYDATVSFSGPMDISSINAVLSDERVPNKGELWNKYENKYEKVAAEICEKYGIDMDVYIALFEQGSRCDSSLFKAIFGANPCLRENRHDLFFLAKKLAEEGSRQRLYAFCGTSDLHYKSNLCFKNSISGLGLDYLFEDGEGGHEWNYWNSKLEKAVRWLLKI